MTLETTLARRLFGAAATLGAAALLVPAAQAQPKPIRIGVPTAMQLQVGRDTQDALKMAIDEINAKGGVLGRKLEMVVADETENPETGISAIKKLTADEKVDVLIGGYTSGVTLAQLPHISAAASAILVCIERHDNSQLGQRRRTHRVGGTGGAIHRHR